MVTNQRCAGPAFEDGIDRIFVLEPIEEDSPLAWKGLRLGRFEMNPFLSDRARDDLHRSRTVVPPGSGADFGHATMACREQRGMPREQSFLRQALVVAAYRVQHRFDNAFDLAVGRLESAAISASLAPFSAFYA